MNFQAKSVNSNLMSLKLEATKAQERAEEEANARQQLEARLQEMKEREGLTSTLLSLAL